MRVTAVIPVGPGHERYQLEAQASVRRAWAKSRGAWTSLVIEAIDDTRGVLGRSRARNNGIRSRRESDWFLLLDADDLMESDGFGRAREAVESGAGLVFGAVHTDTHGTIPENVWPLDWQGLLRHGAAGTLSMGCFVRGDVARAVPFDERLDAGEDFDFYLRACSRWPWQKVESPLVTIRRMTPSAGGPRGYDVIDWRAACEPHVERYRRAEVA